MDVESSVVAQLLGLEIPYISEATAVIVFITVLLGLARKFLYFHTHEILFRRTNNIEATLSKLA
jgi:hypothetical protein